MTSMDVYKKIAAILKRLYLCTEKSQIDELFIAENIFDYKERIELLQECMGAEDICNMPENITAKEEYDFECEVFEEGTWRLLKQLPFAAN